MQTPKTKPVRSAILFVALDHSPCRLTCSHRIQILPVLRLPLPRRPPRKMEVGRVLETRLNRRLLSRPRPIMRPMDNRLHPINRRLQILTNRSTTGSRLRRLPRMVRTILDLRTAIKVHMPVRPCQLSLLIRVSHMEVSNPMELNKDMDIPSSNKRRSPRN